MSARRRATAQSDRAQTGTYVAGVLDGLRVAASPGGRAEVLEWLRRPATVVVCTAAGIEDALAEVRRIYEEMPDA